MTKPLMTPGDLKRRDILTRLAGASAVGLGMSYAAGATKNGIGPGQSKSGKVFPRLREEMAKVARINLVSHRTQFELVKAKVGWVLPQSDFYRVADEPIRRLIQALLDLRYVSIVPQPTKLDAPASHLDPRTGGDGVWLTLETEEKIQLASVTLAQRGNMTLAQLSGDDLLYRVNGVDWPPLNSAKAWLDLPTFNIAPERIATVELARPGQARLDIVRRPDGGFAPVGGIPSPMTTDIALLLGRLEPQDVMAAEKLASTPAFRHTTNLKSGLTIALDGYESAGRFWVKVRTDRGLAASAEEGDRLAAQTNGWAYEVPAKLWTLLMTSTALLLQANP